MSIPAVNPLGHHHRVHHPTLASAGTAKHSKSGAVSAAADRNGDSDAAATKQAGPSSRSVDVHA
jgi:hypothetical protein